jgi:hypothetical protein
MPIPDGNHSRKSTQSATPSQRCTKISARFNMSSAEDATQNTPFLLVSAGKLPTAA